MPRRSVFAAVKVIRSRSGLILVDLPNPVFAGVWQDMTREPDLNQVFVSAYFAWWRIFAGRCDAACRNGAKIRQYGGKTA